MEWMSLTLASLLLSQVGGTRIAPPESQLPAIPSSGAPTVAYPPHPGGTSLVPSTPPGLSATQPQGVLPPTTNPPGLFPSTNATPIQSAPITTSPTTPARPPIIATPPSAVTLTAGEQAAPLAKVDHRTPKADAAELIDTLMTLPEDLRVQGRATQLVELLGPVSDRQQQVLVAHSYWRAVGAILDLRLAHDSLRRLEQLQPLLTAQAQARGRASGALEWQVRMSAARARQAEAELALVTAQHTLAERAGVSREGALPLPSDRPHAGAYRTIVDQIYPGIAVPPQARLFARQAPLRRDTIVQQAAAVQSAYDATSAVIDALNGGNTTAYLLWTALDDLDRAQHALVASVRDYNIDIATYALNVPRGTVSPQELVGMLITPLRSNVATAGVTNPTIMRPNTMMRDDAVAPATFEQPLPAAGRNEPTLAPPRGSVPGNRVEPMSPVPSFGPRQAQRPVLGETTESGLYQALVNQSPAKRAQDLAGLLHWDHTLPDEVGKPVTLVECLRGIANEKRTAVIDAYWQTRELAARLHVLNEKLTQLNNLQIHLTSRATETGAADAMLRLRTAIFLTNGDLLAGRTELSAAQMRLMQATGRAAAGDWIYAATAPHGGRYQLRLEELSANVAANDKVLRLAASIPALHRLLEERAGGIVLADATRVVETNRFIEGAAITDLPIEAVLRQADDSLTFLDTLTRYNREIASFALTVLPANSAAETLVQTLVVHDGPGQ
jgi:hypothetical protein